jgi:hypothetical protein
MLTTNDLQQIRLLIQEVLENKGSFNNSQIYSLQDPEVISLLGIPDSIKHPVMKAIKELESHGIELIKKRKGGTTVFGSELNKYIELKKKKSYDKN